MRPSYVTPSDADQAFVHRWSIAATSVMAVLTVLLIGAAAVAPAPPPEARPRAEAVPHHACASWDATARQSIAGLLREPGDAALRQAGEVMFRLRRARRNCEHGWVRLACQDYLAVMHPGDTAALPAASSICWPALQTNAAATE